MLFCFDHQRLSCALSFSLGLDNKEIITFDTFVSRFKEFKVGDTFSSVRMSVCQFVCVPVL